MEFVSGSYSMYKTISHQVFVNPHGGKRGAVRQWRNVEPLFEVAGVERKVIRTERRGQAWEHMAQSSDAELAALDGIVIVGGDGFFNEVLNGLLQHRHSAPDFTVGQDGNGNGSAVAEAATSARSSDSVNDSVTENGHQNDSLGMEGGWAPLAGLTAAELEVKRKVRALRIGIIPAGSTDTILMSTTGSRDPQTAALQIILGKKMPLDIVRVRRNKAGRRGEREGEARYAASFCGYGFYGDVALESEFHRWMGPIRYDFAGFLTFLRHRRYEAEVSYLEFPEPSTDLNSDSLLCKTNCSVCSAEQPPSQGTPSRPPPAWKKVWGNFHSVGCAVMSCRNPKALSGLVAGAHLADGAMHLILIGQCSRPDYLHQLIRLTSGMADPLDFPFIQHHKIQAFTFSSKAKESVWSVDGELFPASELSGQVFRGLINVFAQGPEH